MDYDEMARRAFCAAILAALTLTCGMAIYILLCR